MDKTSLGRLRSSGTTERRSCVAAFAVDIAQRRGDPVDLVTFLFLTLFTSRSPLIYLGLDDVPVGRSPRPHPGLLRLVGGLRGREIAAPAGSNDVQRQAEDDRRNAILCLPLGHSFQGSQKFPHEIET